MVRHLMQKKFIRLFIEFFSIEFFFDFFNDFSTLLLCKINGLEILNRVDFFLIFTSLARSPNLTFGWKYLRYILNYETGTKNKKGFLKLNFMKVWQ